MAVCKISLSLNIPLKKGERIYICSDGVVAPHGVLKSRSALPAMRVGDRLVEGDGGFRVLSVGWMSGGARDASGRVYLIEAEHDLKSGELHCSLESRGYSLAWITLSDKGSAGKRHDESGPLVGEIVARHLDLGLTQGFIIPDEVDQLKGLLSDLALVQGFDLILTTGGTGVAPRDITPEATLAVIEKRLPGYERAMTDASLAKTPHGAISRAVAGTLGHAVIVNMPGSPKAVAECLEPLLPTLRHTLEKLQGDPSDCAILRK
ncbi:MAG: MogA/MoaB family molybdenum cofactor biosynthesis protein [Pseudodesulfovibrio sp.]|nr:MogA/MoaB family molybdenum cofactor biosynthesis protein [Pseudodesulfovibrio sp.]